MSKLFPYRLKKFPHSSHQLIGLILNQKKPSSILDLGSGEGFLAKNLNYQPEVLVGIDKLEFKKLTGYTQFYQLDLERGELPFKRPIFEVVVLADVLEHLEKPQNLLKQVKLVLKPGGFILISVPNCDFWLVKFLISLGIYPQMEWGPFDKTHSQFFNFSSLSQLLKKQKLAIKKVDYTPVPLPLTKLLPTFQRPFFKLFWLSNLLIKPFPRVFAYQIIVEVQVDH